MNRHTMYMKELVALLLLIIIDAALVTSGYWYPQGSTHDPNVLRVVAPNRERVVASLSPYGPGFDQELAILFAKRNEFELRLQSAESREQALLMLARGEADLVIGFAGLPEELEGISSGAVDAGMQDGAQGEGLLMADSSSALKSPYSAGPVYFASQPLLVHSAQRYGLRRESEMCRVPVLMNDDPEMAAQLASVSEELDCLPWTSSTDGLHATPILDTLSENKARFALLEDTTYSLWQPFFPNVKPAKPMGSAREYRWFWRTDDERLHTKATAFWQKRSTREVLDDLNEKYFGFLPEEVDYYDINKLGRSVRRALPRYRNALTEASVRNAIDPLLLAAVIYQESRFNPAAESRTGVRGLMMLTRDTARRLGVNRLDPMESIEGGSRYLKMLWNELESMNLDPWDRWFFALAGYNLGIGHVYDAIDLAQSMGGRGDTWRELKKILPLLAWKKYYSRTKHGYCRGFEAVTYVENIRYYYYILNGLVVLSRPEAEYLGPLLGAIPEVWPAVVSSDLALR